MSDSRSSTATVRPLEARLLDALSEYAVFALDDAGRIASWNTGAERLFGYRADEAVGLPLDRLYADRGDESDLTARNFATARRDGHLLDEAWYVRQDGRRFFGHGMLAALTGGSDEMPGFVKLLHDATERKTQDERLASAHAAVAARERLLRQFIHDLRTPVSAITLWTSLLAEPEAMSSEQLADALAAIQQSAEELQAIVEQLAASRRPAP